MTSRTSATKNYRSYASPVQDEKVGMGIQSGYYPPDAPCNVPLSQLPNRRGQGMIPIFYGKVSDHYTFLRQIGHGSFGKVYEAVPKQTHAENNLCARPSSMRVAIKVFDLVGPPEQKPGWKNRIVNMFRMEVEVGRKCDHPNLIKIYETFEAYDDNNQLNEVATVIELCEGDLLNVVVAHNKGMPLDASRHVLHQIGSAVRHMHERGFIHRDLKLENIFYLRADNWNNAIIKLGDFGSVIHKNGHLVRSRGGSPSYLPPEVWQSIGWSPKGDSWSFGVVSYAVLVGSMPFPQPAHVGADQTMKLVTKGEANYSRSAWVNLDKKAQSFVQRLMTVQIPMRASIEETMRCPFFECYEFPQQWSPWQVSVSLNAWGRLNRIAQLILHAVAASITDAEVPSASWLFSALDKRGEGYLGSTREISAIVAGKGANPHNTQDRSWHASHQVSADFDCLEGVGYTEFLAIMLAKPEIWFQRSSKSPKFHQYNRAVLRCLCSDSNPVLMPSDLASWLNSADKWACSTAASDSDDSPQNSRHRFILKSSGWDYAKHSQNELNQFSLREKNWMLNEVGVSRVLEQVASSDSELLFFA